MLKQVIGSAVITFLVYVCLDPFGWTETQTTGLSIVITLVCSLLIGIMEELIKLNKK